MSWRFNVIYIIRTIIVGLLSVVDIYILLLYTVLYSCDLYSEYVGIQINGLKFIQDSYLNIFQNIHLFRIFSRIH